MKDLGMKLYIRARNLADDNGQDLIEYALVVALIAFAATAGMSTLATQDQPGIREHRKHVNDVYELAAGRSL